MKKLLKRLWKGVNGLSAIDLFETGITFTAVTNEFIKDDLELHDRTHEKSEKDVKVKESKPTGKSQSTSDGPRVKP